MAETLNFGIKGMDCVSWLKGYPRDFIILLMIFMVKQLQFSRNMSYLISFRYFSVIRSVDLKKLCRSKQTVNFSEMFPFCFSKCCRHLKISHCSVRQDENRAEDQFGVLANNTYSWGQRE